MLKLMDKYQIKADLFTNRIYRISSTYTSVLLYVLVNLKGTDKFLVYQRPEERGKFSGLKSIGYCGAVELEDHIYGEDDTIDIFKTIVTGGLRELDEETTLSEGTRKFVESDLTFIGIINSRPSCVVSVVEYDGEIDGIRVTEPENIHVGWRTLQELTELRGEMEGWSAMVIDVLSKFYKEPSESFESNKAVVWKKIPGYSKYRAGSDGSLKNVESGHISTGGNAGRYLKVSVYPDGKKEAHLEYLHILICKAFKGMPKEGQVVLHCDNNRNNVKPANLRWGTQSQNIQNAYDDGLVKAKYLKSKN